jgi:hypothetical protein
MLLVLGVLFMCSCASNTPQSRIAKRPQVFATLPEKHKTMVQRGQIAEGMGKDAVWFAWGPAQDIFTASEKGNRSEIWRYLGQRAVYRNSIGIGYSTGFYGGRCSRYHVDPFLHYDVGPYYIPYTAAEVKFQKEKVVSWQAVNR